jgi:hypothetical protein
MKRYRLTIAGSIGLVSLIALGLAALRLADERSASSVYSLAILATLSAMLGAAFARVDLQAFCAGFATFCGAYLLLIFGPWSSATIVGYPVAIPAPRPPLSSSRSDEVRVPLIPEMWIEILYDLQERRPTNYAVGDKVETLWRDAYYASTVIEAIDESYKVHYDNYDALADEWVDSSRLMHRKLNHGPFLKVGHSLFGLLFGLVGGSIAVLFHRSRRSDQAQMVERPPSS